MIGSIVLFGVSIPNFTEIKFYRDFRGVLGYVGKAFEGAHGGAVAVGCAHALRLESTLASVAGKFAIERSARASMSTKSGMLDHSLLSR